MEGKAITEYASLGGKIHTLVIDKTLSISGAAADAKAVGEAFEKYEPSAVQKALDEHANNKSNPHAVTAAQVGAYSKDETMSDATKDMFPNVASPNGAFSAISPLLQHWWQLIPAADQWVRHETRTNITTNVTVNDTDLAITNVSYSNSIEFDKLTGEVHLVDAKTVSLTRAGDNQGAKLTALAPVYIYEPRNKKVYYLPDGATASTKDDGSTVVHIGMVISLSVKATIPAQLVGSETEHVPVGKAMYEHSVDRNAYPDTGEVDGFKTHYLGLPIERAATALKIATGEYIGTGTYGESNPNTLTFGFDPYVVFVSPVNKNTSGMLLPTLGAGQYRSAHNSLTLLNVSYADGTVSWNTTGYDAIGQMNEENVIYKYFAIGL